MLEQDQAAVLRQQAAQLKIARQETAKKPENEISDDEKPKEDPPHLEERPENFSVPRTRE